MNIIKHAIGFYLVTIAGKFIKDNTPSLHISNIKPRLKTLRDFGLGFIVLLLVKARIIKISRSNAITLVLVVFFAVLAAKLNEHNKLKTVKA